MRRRLVQFTVAAAVLAVGLFGLPLAVAIGQDAEANELRHLERVAEATALAVATDVFEGQVPSGLPDQADDVELALYDHHGALILGSGPPKPGPHVQRAMTAQVSAGEAGDALVVAVPVTHDRDVIGVVRAATPALAVARTVWLAWLAMAALAATAVGAVYIVARRQARTIARPLEDLSRAAHRLGDGDFSARAAPAAIPEIDSVGDSLNSTARRLGDLVQRERSFSADASHQLRTPLAGLRLELEAALDSRRADVTPALLSAIAAVDRLEQTIEKLLALARDDRRDVEPIDVHSVLDEIEHDWLRRPATAQRPLRITIDPQAPPCVASGTAVRQVLAVLLDNAAAHGGGAVTVTARDAGEVLAIDVSDQGSGVTVPESDLFVRRADTARGHGIGLALARSLAEAEGGRLWLTSAHPATFTLLLPGADSTAGRERALSIAADQADWSNKR
ncbi:HAMP domain-containing sensor histidine kinase [Pseudonocardia aurantiaca]|uniref:histidine kinase n=1 Tax=Pseudonocardia aurantiaca TaxID=75290 RepID=A0ABW4FNI2_9PSEU